MFACLLLRLVYFYFNCWIKSNHSWNKAEAIRCMTWWLGGHCWRATKVRSHECSNTLLVWRSPPCTPCWHWKAFCHRTFTTLWLSFWHAPCLHHKIRFWDKSLFDSVWQQSDRQFEKNKMPSLRCPWPIPKLSDSRHRGAGAPQPPFILSEGEDVVSGVDVWRWWQLVPRLHSNRFEISNQ